ncbi:hypothetical protein EHI8A_026710 [Entamoeba histolytica HM-1:IMSS-B]|uniref:Uncharacterized protein n=5 Tax=Entamoeba histolytica TaxID=5759 RepID=C4M686_ENTH1|nr:hypothetical protein EHI_081660 [Entamoeba histolytica HM-1:IMSS]EMD49323.1 Hypothetical protein EHI5A_052540 [Entamoeba histolytica KU27]EMH76149.1 hypothetical protein EHI8A_026710 [Entamoeba histolytica HM-1:IMSS-B]EMS16034.1 hypothetical protein KM1_063870 [Entamoeba histolytica HM-3:IMSS]ENY59757.1 hypothetical protein EHI7A_029440 [Entamoeba histolytica HM-1:IMSS-A]EAL46632.1 hypothetical protein EHI_081660 [Entamoeba histolytica HM-1:IMSS]|eukprot:XP_652018.1 hypothetical protein EHI_081660 [Entamoeba histolytica HM-1:IMSS]
MSEENQQQPETQQVNQTSEKQEENVELIDIIKITDQKQKCEEIEMNQKEIQSIIKDQLQHVAHIQQLISEKSKDFDKTIDQSIAIVKDTRNDLLVIQAKLQFDSYFYLTIK